jgi:phage tail-like protein
MLPRLDPLRGYNFIITMVDSSETLMTVLSVIGSVALGGFKECTGLESTLEVEEYKEGGNNASTLKFPTRTNTGPIRLKRGVGLGDDLWNWHNEFVFGRGKRKNGLIVLQNDDQIPIKIWVFNRGIPTKFVGPSLDATRSAVAIEELEVVHEGLSLVSPGTIGAAAINTVF